MSSLGIVIAGSGAYCVVLGFFVTLCKAAARPAPLLERPRMTSSTALRPDGLR